MKDMISGPFGDVDFDGHGYDKDFASAMSMLENLSDENYYFL